MSRSTEDSTHESTPVRNNKSRHITRQGQDHGHTDSPWLLNSRDGVVSGTTRQCQVVCWGLSRIRQHRDFDRTPVLCHATQRNATTSRRPRKLLHITAPWHQNDFPFDCASKKKSTVHQSAVSLLLPRAGTWLAKPPFLAPSRDTWPDGLTRGLECATSSVRPGRKRAD